MYISKRVRPFYVSFWYQMLQTKNYYYGKRMENMNKPLGQYNTSRKAIKARDACTGGGDMSASLGPS